MNEEIIRIGSRSYGKTFDEYWNRIINLEQKNKQLKETLKDIEELLLSEEQPVQPCNIRYDILEITKKALGGKENEHN